MNNILLTLLLSSVVYAATTTTTTTFGNENSMGMNKYGNAIYNRTVTIKTDNYKVDNFWKKFSYSGEGQDQIEFESIAKTGTMQISVESTSICSIFSELDSQGCSGQKPFLINNEALIGKNSGDTITLLFQKNFEIDKVTYNDTNSSVFYPLNIDRNEKYYKEVPGNTKTFYSFFGRMFNAFLGDGNFFSQFFSYKVSDNSGKSVEDIREKYIANIVSGIDQEHLVVRGATLETDISQLNTLPVSLIDYSETQTTGTNGSCNLFFFKFSETSSFCNFMGGMPFISLFSSTTTTVEPEVYEIDTIQTDTENSLVTFASSFSGVTMEEYQNNRVYREPVIEASKRISIFDTLKCFIFRCSDPNIDEDTIDEPKDTYYTFNDPVNLTFAVTDLGAHVDSFQTFKLKSIHSLTGEARMCKVEENNEYDTWGTATFKPSGTTSKTFTNLGSVTKEKWCNPLMGSDYKYEWGYCRKSYYKTNISEQQSLKTPLEWLDWCDYAIDNNPVTYKEVCDESCILWFCKDVNCRQEANPIVVDGYTIKEYVKSSKRGMALELELVNLKTNSDAVTLRYKLMGTD